MNKTIKFEIVTPERVVLKEEIRQATLPAKTGEITVLPNHIPLVASLDPGVIEIVDKNGERGVISTSGGFVEVLRDKIVILADTAERAEEIDMDRVEEARRSAEKIKEEVRHVDRERFAGLSAKIAKELARARAAQRWKKLKNIK